MSIEVSVEKYKSLQNDNFFKCLGRVENVVGLTIESAGPEARLGDLCLIRTDGGRGDPVCRCIFLHYLHAVLTADTDRKGL